MKALEDKLRGKKKPVGLKSDDKQILSEESRSK
jgi:hypothetical protein